MDAHAFDFVEQDITLEQANVVTLFGEDAFLQGTALKHLQAQLFGPSDDSCSVTEWEGRQCEWRDISDELRTVSLFGDGGRCAIIREADDFVSAHREPLEKYVANPAKSGCLVLIVKSWPKNTRLAKAILKSGLTIECRPPQRKAGKKTATDTKRLLDWMVKRAKATYQTKLARPAAQQLLDLSGEHLGLIDQELSKLSLYTDGKREMTPEEVVSIVGGWRTQTTWDLLDAVCEGNAKEAITQLDHLLMAGEHPQALFGAFSWTLRRYGIATRHVERQQSNGQRVNLQQALVDAGIHKFQAGNAEPRLRQIGFSRAKQLLSWLVEADAQMKGSHSSPDRARYVLEQLIFRLCRHADERQTAAAQA
jgi:DNA polymerase-3 subunit delta